MSYLDNFVASMKYLEEFDEEAKLAKPSYEQIKRTIASRAIEHKEDYGRFTEMVYEFAGKFIENCPYSFSNLCHSASQMFYERWSQLPISQPFPVAVTIGHVTYKEVEIYKINKESLKNIISEGFQPNRELNVHVWLTLPNMKVLDLAIIPTLIEKGLASHDEFKKSSHLLWNENETSNFKYEPLLQHNHFLYLVDRVKGYV